MVSRKQKTETQNMTPPKQLIAEIRAHLPSTPKPKGWYVADQLLEKAALALEEDMAALLKAREYCDDLEESAGRLAMELGAPPDGWRIKGPRLAAELEAEKQAHVNCVNDYGKALGVLREMREEIARVRDEWSKSDCERLSQMQTYTNWAREAEDALDESKDHVKELGAALEFYADDKTYDHDALTDYEGSTADIWGDKGERARLALKGSEVTK